ncbi:MAG: ATP-binding cassette domain-containing protein, partial [Clostridia bacterium]
MPHFTGAENIMLGDEPHIGPMVNRRELFKRAYELKSRLGIEVPLDVPVQYLGAGTQQIIEIIRAFSANPKVLILDEPTASLGEGEVAPFLEFIKRLKKENSIAIIFISHKLEEVYEIADTISVFTEGRCIVTNKAKSLTHEDCIRSMLKNNDMKPFEIKGSNVNQDEVVLEVGDCDYDERTHHIGIKVYRGEVVGLYGLVGSGRTEFAEAIYGVRRMQHADIVFNGEKIKQCETQKMIDRGMIMTPEKRANAIFASDKLIDNIAILFMGKLCSKFLGFIQPKRNENIALKVLQENKVKYSDPKQAIRELSG